MDIPRSLDKPARLLRRHAFIIACMAAAALIYSLNYSPEVATPDGSSYMLLGRHILDGSYTEGFLHRMPLLPAMFSALFMAGLSPVSIAFAVPLLFLELSILFSFLLFRELSGEKAAMISSVLLLSFPEFWRWGLKFLTDIPVLAMTSATFYFFLKARKSSRYYIHAGIAAGLGLLTKPTCAVLPLILLAYIIFVDRIRRPQKEMMIGTALAAAIFFTGLLLSLALGGSDVLYGGPQIVAEDRMTPLVQIITGRYTTLPYLLNFALFPAMIFAPLGAFVMWKKKEILPLLFSAAIFVLIFVFWVVRLRYYSPLFPFICLFTAEGFLLLYKRVKGKMLPWAVAGLFAALVVICFMDSMYLLSLDSGMSWGVVTISNYTSGLHGLIASDYMPDYINLTADVVTDSAWVSAAFSSTDAAGLREILSEKRSDYVILSIYGEFSRSPTNETYHPMLGPLEIAFVSRPYTGERVPPDYAFCSPLYESIEADAGFTRVKTIYRDNQAVFVIYKVGPHS